MKSMWFMEVPMAKQFIRTCIFSAVIIFSSGMAFSQSAELTPVNNGDMYTLNNTMMMEQGAGYLQPVYEMP